MLCCMASIKKNYFRHDQIYLAYVTLYGYIVFKKVILGIICNVPSTFALVSFRSTK